jgi:hypothetical protein
MCLFLGMAAQGMMTTAQVVPKHLEGWCTGDIVCVTVQTNLVGVCVSVLLLMHFKRHSVTMRKAGRTEHQHMQSYIIYTNSNMDAFNNHYYQKQLFTLQDSSVGCLQSENNMSC